MSLNIYDKTTDELNKVAGRVADAYTKAQTDEKINANNSSIVGGDEWTQRTYSVGETCVHNNKVWYCIANTNEEPSESATTYWKKINLAKITPMLYTGNWNVTKSAANGPLTEAITVPKGLYLVTFAMPIITTSGSMPVFVKSNGNVINNSNFSGTSQTSKVFIYEATEESVLQLMSGTGAAWDFNPTYINRGGLSAIKLS